MNPQKLQNSIIILLFMVVSVFVTYVGLKIGLPLVMMAWAFFPVLVYFTNRPDILLCITIALFGSQLQVPGLPGGLTLYYIVAFLFVVIAFFGKVINRMILYDLKLSEWLVVLFLINVMVVIGARGVGFSALGDQNVGGMRYVSLVIPCAMFLLVRYVPLTPKQYQKSFLWMLALSCLPFVGEVLIVLSGGAFYHLYYVISFTELTLGTVFDYAEGEGIVRFFSSSSAAQAIAVFALYFVGVSNSRKFITGLLLLFALALGSLSGHRIVLIRILMLIWVFGFFYKREKMLRYCFLSVVLLIIFVMALYLLAPYLPHNAQRMISFLPGVNISVEAQLSASATTTWRLNVWMEAIGLIPEYFWLGRGYTFPDGITEALMLGAMHDYVYYWALETAAYHNGMLSLIIGLGISGFILGCWLMIAICLRNYKAQQGEWNSSVLKRVHNMIFIYALVYTVMFFTIYGDVHVSMPRIFFYFLVMENICYSDRRQAEKSLAPVLP